MKKLTIITIALLFIISIAAYAETKNIVGETILMPGTVPAKLMFDNIKPGSVEVRSKYNKEDKLGYTDSTTLTIYKEGVDYIIDYKNGTIQRTANSKIPDYSKNDVLRKKMFNHATDKIEFANYYYQTYIDYTTTNYINYFDKTGQAKFLPRTTKKLKNGTPIKYVAFGDSITAGGDSTSPTRIYFNRWVNHLKDKYKKANITVVNGATGGDTTVQGLERFNDKVLKENPDLISIAFGMNDNNTIGISPSAYKDNLNIMIKKLKAQNPNVEIILLSCFSPNDKWFYNSKQMPQFAKVTQEVAKENETAFVNIYSTFKRFTDIKGQSSMLGNNINHPTDFGHWVYEQAIENAIY